MTLVKMIHENVVHPGSRMVCIIGERPGKARKRCSKYSVFHGNKSGDLIEKILPSLKRRGFILMNVVPFHIAGMANDEARFYDSEKDYRIFALILKTYFIQYGITQVVCLGEFACMIFKKYCSTIKRDFRFTYTKLPHPSYIIRFKKDEKLYIDTFLKKVLP